MKRVALYARVSTDQQHDNDSIPSQLSALEKYAEEHHYIIYDRYVDDGVSGTLLHERDELQRLLGDVKRGNIDIILFTKLDRYFRSIKHYLNTQAVLDEYKVGWKAIWESYETMTPGGRLMVNQMLSFAQFEAENAGFRTRQVFAYKKSQREVVSGKIPYGYSIVNKHLVPNEDAENVKKIFDLYLETNSMCETIRLAQDFKIPRSQRGLKHLLQNRKYIGEAYGLDDYCEPIVDRKTFDDVQRLLEINVKMNRTHDYIFSGILVCNDCGSKMAGAHDTYKRKGERYYKYRCTGYYRPIKICKNSKSPNEKKLEKFLMKNLEQFAFGEVDVKDANDTIDYGKLIEATERKIAREKELYVNELITLEEYKKDIGEFNTQIVGYKKKQSENQSVGREELKRLIGRNIADWYWTLDNKEKRSLWRSVIKEIRVGYDKKIHVAFL